MTFETEPDHDFKCEHCGWHGSFLKGPVGGTNVNFACPICWARYDDAWPFGVRRDPYRFVAPGERQAFSGFYTPRKPLAEKEDANE